MPAFIIKCLCFKVNENRKERSRGQRSDGDITAKSCMKRKDTYAY